VFGYEHPPGRVFAFLKYIPETWKNHFNVDYLGNTWKHEKQKLFRAEQLYTAKNYQTFLETFRKNFTDFVYFCPFREKEVLTVPLNTIKQVYVPNECLQRLVRIKKKDSLQRMAIDLIKMLSAESGIGTEDFGVHGSIALNMHTAKSDIDIVVYGADNFRRLERTIDKLVKTGTLSYRSNNRLDAARHCKVKYQNKTFMYNAIRKAEEIKSKYGELKYTRLNFVNFKCTVKDDAEAMFRPAIYKIKDYQPDPSASAITEGHVPELVVSMIGCYRNVARTGDMMTVSGMLERAENHATGQVFHQVVVGTGVNEEEHIWPI
jgi:predicted nucleotidyltransferase